MGVCNFDKEASTKRLETKYVLDTEEGVKKLLEDIHTLESHAYVRGDTASIDLLVDLESAINQSEMTDRQRQAIQLLYYKDLDITVTAAIMGCDKSTASRHRKAGIKHITKIFTKWEYN